MKISPRAAALLAAGFGLLAGCASQPVPPPVTAENLGAAFSARTLDDAGLQQFLAKNLGTRPAAWDFEALAWVAFHYHPSLELARAQWSAGQAAAQTASARPNPTISLVPGYNTTREPGISPWFPAINLDFLLTGSGKRAHQADLAQAESEAARLTVLATAWQVRGELRRALADLEVARQRTVLLQDQAGLQEKLLQLSEQRRAAGSATAGEISAVRLAFMKNEAAVAEAANQAAAARVRVAAALGLPLTALDGVALPVPPVVPMLSADALAAARRQSLQSRADVLAALAHYQSAQAALELEVARQQPDIHLGPGYQWDQGANKWSLALTFELPIFHRNEGPIAEAVARRAAAAAQFTVVQAQAVAAIDTAIALQSAALAQLQQVQRFTAELQKQAALAQQRRELGASDQVEVLTVRLDVTAGALAQIDAEAAVSQSAGQLEDALQVPFPHLAALADPANPTTPRQP